MIGQKTIFIIDDHPDSLRAMCLALAGETYRLETADSAQSATKKLSSFHPDLILLDARIPVRDGTRFARRLLADEELSSVPIVALTEAGTGTPDPEWRGRFDGQIGKPIDTGTFPGRVRAFLDSPWQASSNHPAELTLPAIDLLDAIVAGLPDSQLAAGTWTGLHRLSGVVVGLQHDELADYLQQAERLSNTTTARARSRFRLLIRACRELVEREPDLVTGLAELRTAYLDHRRAESSHLDRALQNGDFGTLRKAGHNLKGTGAAYGFAELTDLGRALEAAANNDNAAAAEALLDQIECYISIVRPSPQQQGDYAGI
jgi:CheY-like chemotaxis protein/HPt (histidine-containing phosphotransfer) domain-containing protein